jgi:hypothetical protein
MSKKYVITLVEDDDGNLVLPFTDEILNEAGWEEGDSLEWKDNKDGTFSLSKKEKETEEMEWVLVECVSQFRQRYMCEVPKGKAEYALDTVTMNEAKEFSQEHLGEIIISHRVVSKEEALVLCDENNYYAASWNEETKMDAFFTKYESPSFGNEHKFTKENEK